MKHSYLNALGIVSALGQGQTETLASLTAGNADGVTLQPNILANKPIVKELIQWNANANNISK